MLLHGLLCWGVGGGVETFHCMLKEWIISDLFVELTELGKIRKKRRKRGAAEKIHMHDFVKKTLSCFFCRVGIYWLAMPCKSASCSFHHKPNWKTGLSVCVFPTCIIPGLWCWAVSGTSLNTGRKDFFLPASSTCEMAFFSKVHVNKQRGKKEYIGPALFLCCCGKSIQNENIKKMRWKKKTKLTLHSTEFAVWD